MSIKYFALLIILLIILSGCINANENKKNENTTIGKKQNSDFISDKIENKELTKCTNKEASGTEEEINEFLNKEICINDTKREGIYPYSLEKVGSSKEIYKLVA